MPHHPPLRFVTQIEDTIYTPEDARNGAGPHWCFGSSTIVRRGDRVFCSGLETLPGEVPLNNTRWFINTRRDGEHGWTRMFTDYFHRTREPNPIAITDAGMLYTTANPTLAPSGEYAGQGVPTFHAFDVSRLGAEAPAGPHNMLEPTATQLPPWCEPVKFTEHSYRSLACDAVTGEAFLLNNLGMNLAHWALRRADGRFAATGKLHWPREVFSNGQEQPLRVCYPAVVQRGKAVHVLGISDIEEFDPRLSELKLKLTGNQWDYLFCRMLYTYTPDVTTTPFLPWLEVANVEPTRGWTLTGDMHVDDEGAAHLLWYENNVTPLLRDAVFPGVPVEHGAKYARVKDGRVVQRVTAFGAQEKQPGFSPRWTRFHHTASGRRLVVASGRNVINGRVTPMTAVRELLPDDTLGEVYALNLIKPFDAHFFTATRRTGSTQTHHLDLLGSSSETNRAVRYARVLIEE